MTYNFTEVVKMIKYSNKYFTDRKFKEVLAALKKAGLLDKDSSSVFTINDIALIETVFEIHLKQEKQARQRIKNKKKARKKHVSYDLAVAEYQKGDKTPDTPKVLSAVDKLNNENKQIVKKAGPAKAIPVSKTESKEYDVMEHLRNKDIDLAEVGRQFLRNLNPFHKGPKPKASKKSRLVVWILAGLTTFLIVGGGYLAYEQDQPVAVVHSLKEYHNINQFHNLVVNGEYGLKNHKVAVISYTTKDGWYAANYNLSSHKLSNVSVIDNNTTINNPIIQIQLLKKAWADKDGKIKPINTLETDPAKQSMTINHHTYQAHYSNGLLYGYLNDTTGVNTNFSTYDNELLKQTGQKSTLAKDHVNPDKAIILSLNFDKTKHTSSVWLLDTDGATYRVDTTYNNKVHLGKFGNSTKD